MTNRCIFIVTSQYLPEVGGMGSFLAELAAGFAGRDWETLVIARSSAGSARFDSLEGEVRHPRVVYRYPEIPGWDFLTVFLKGLWLIWRRRPPFIIIGNWYPHALIAFAWRALTGTPYFVILHATEFTPHHPSLFKQFVKRLVMKTLPFVLSKANGLLANSVYTKEVAQQYLGARSHRIAVLHPPVGQSFFEPVDEQMQLQIRSQHGLLGKKVIVTIGLLIPRKGFHRILEALPRILELEPTVHYLIVGDGPEREALKKQVVSLGLEATVSFTGSIPYDQMRHYYAVADVFAMICFGLPEERQVESFGIVYVEAGAMGKAVVASTERGVSDAVVEGVTAVLVDPHDRDAIAQAIISLLANPAQALAMGAAGRERALLHFTPEAIAGDALDTMAKLLQETGLPERD